MLGLHEASEEVVSNQFKVVLSIETDELLVSLLDEVDCVIGDDVFEYQEMVVELASMLVLSFLAS